MVAAVLGKVADRHGHRVILVPGALVWAASLLWYLDRVGPNPAFLSEWLPAQLIQGLGVGATLPVLGAVLGIALLVVLIGTPTQGQASEALRHGWVFASICFVVVAIGSLFIGRTEYQPEEVVLDLRGELPLPRKLRDVEQPTLRAAAPEPPVDLGDLTLFAGLPAPALAQLEQGGPPRSRYSGPSGICLSRSFRWSSAASAWTCSSGARSCTAPGASRMPWPARCACPGSTRRPLRRDVARRRWGHEQPPRLGPLA